jgi:hypothetical protein
MRGLAGRCAGADGELLCHDPRLLIHQARLALLCGLGPRMVVAVVVVRHLLLQV